MLQRVPESDQQIWFTTGGAMNFRYISPRAPDRNFLEQNRILTGRVIHGPTQAPGGLRTGDQLFFIRPGQPAIRIIAVGFAAVTWQSIRGQKAGLRTAKADVLTSLPARARRGGHPAERRHPRGRTGAAIPNASIFSLARYLPSEPEVGSFVASANPVASDSSVTLTATNITDGNPNSTITQMAFYANVNGANTWLGDGTQSSPGEWTFTWNVTLAPGTYTLTAQAEDSYGVVGDPDALTFQVT